MLNIILVLIFFSQLFLPIAIHAESINDSNQSNEELVEEANIEEEKKAEEKKKSEEEKKAEEKKKVEEEKKVEEARKAEEEKKAKEEKKAEEEKKAKEAKKEAEQKEEGEQEVKEEPEKERKKESEQKEKKEDKKENEDSNTEEEEIEKDQGLEYYPSIAEPTIGLAGMMSRLSNLNTKSSSIEDTIEVNKWAKRLLGLCRVFEVNLEITGEPQEAPVDVVLVIDRSGSMNESSSSGNDYFSIVAEPANDQTYYVKVNGQYRSVQRVNVGSTWNPIYRWRYTVGGTRYVEWDANGDDNSPGSTNQNNPVAKPFYVQGNSRLYYAKKAAINFAAKVLGPDGSPGSRVSIVSFAGPTAFGNTGHDGEARLDQPLTNNLQSIQNTVNGITANGGTNTQAGYRRAKKEIEDNGNPNANKVVIMFTDGMPNASDKGQTLQSHENTTVATIHTNAAIEAAEQIFNPGIADVFSVGLFQGMSGPVKNFAEEVLTDAQNKGYYDAPTAQDLDQIFDDIATHLGYAATNAKVVDKIGDNFNLIESSLPAGATYNPTTREISWNIGTIVDEAKLTYQVVAKPDFEGGLADTNEFAKLTYTDVFGEDNQTKDFPVPEVDVPTLLEAILTDANITLGDSIDLGIGTDENGENYLDIFGGDGDGTYTYEWRVKGETEVFSTDRNPNVSPTEDTVYELTVTDSNNCIAVAEMTVFVNEKIGKISIEKIVNDLDMIMALDFFGVEDTSIFADETFEIKVTGPDGFEELVYLKHGESEILEELAFGEYTIEELNINEYFLLDHIDPTSFELTKETQEVDVVVTNKVNYTTFEFIKVDEDGEALEGIEFELTKGNDKQTVTTDDDGKVSFNFIEPGEYTLKETKTIAGFKLPTETWLIKVVKDETTGELRVEIPDDSFLTGTAEDGYELGNTKQSEFPQTGGIGSLIYLSIGTFIIGSGVNVTRRKKYK